MDSEKKLWPVTIIKTRYSGTYEGSKWAAFNLDHEYIPDAVTGDDISCSTWWSHFGGGVGLGATPDEAYQDLVGLDRRLQWEDIRDLAAS